MKSILEDPAALPDLLFHYTSRDTAIEHILATRQFRLSPMGRTRDPLDFMERNYVLIGSGLPPDGIDNKHFQTEFELKNLKEQAKIACFTADSERIESAPHRVLRRGFARSRMWSQYGEEHRGVCLVFSKNEFHRKVFALKETEVDRVYEGPVCYDEDRIYKGSVLYEGKRKVDRLNGDKLKEISVKEYVASFLDEHNRSLFFEKPQDYRDENEYRFILVNSISGCATVQIADCLKVVIAGFLLPTVYYSLIARLAQEVQAEFKILRWPQGLPDLNDG